MLISQFIPLQSIRADRCRDSAQTKSSGAGFNEEKRTIKCGELSIAVQLHEIGNWLTSLANLLPGGGGIHSCNPDANDDADDRPSTLNGTLILTPLLFRSAGVIVGQR